MNEQPIADTGEKRKYFSMIPFMVDDFGLDPYEHRMYCHLVRRAGERLEVAIGVRAIAEHCGLAKSTVEKVKRSLQDKGLIDVVKQSFDKPDLIRIVDIWNKNKQRYEGGCTATQDSIETKSRGVSYQTVQGCTVTQDSKYITTVDSTNTNTLSDSQAKSEPATATPVQQGTLLEVSKPRKAPKVDKPAKEKKANLWEFISLLAEVCGIDAKVNNGMLAATAKKLSTAEYTVDDVKWFAEKVWPKDWRAENGQKPNIRVINMGIMQAKEERLKAPPPRTLKTVIVTDPFTGEKTTQQVMMR